MKRLKQWLTDEFILGVIIMVILAVGTLTAAWIYNEQISDWYQNQTLAERVKSIQVTLWFFFGYYVLWGRK